MTTKFSGMIVANSSASSSVPSSVYTDQVDSSLVLSERQITTQSDFPSFQWASSLSDYVLILKCLQVERQIDRSG